MENKKLSPFHVVSLLFMFNVTSIIVFGGFNKSGAYFFIAPIISSVIGLFYTYMIFRCNSDYPDLSFFEVSEKIMGKTVGTVISVIYLLFSIYITMRILKNSALFIHTVSLEKTPEPVIMACIAALALYGVSAGKTCIIRLSVISFVITVLTLIFSFVLNIENISWDFFKGTALTPEDFLTDTLNYLILPFSEYILIYNFMGKTKNKSFKPIAIGGILSGLTLGLIGFMLCGVLGLNNTREQMYPFYSAISVLSVGKSFSRIEIIVGATLIYSLIIKLFICVTCIKDYGKHYIGNKYGNIFTVSVVGVIVLLGFFFTGEKYHLTKIINEYLIVAPIITLGIPLLFYTTAKIKNK